MYLDNVKITNHLRIKNGSHTGRYDYTWERENFSVTRIGRVHVIRVNRFICISEYLNKVQMRPATVSGAADFHNNYNNI